MTRSEVQKIIRKSDVQSNVFSYLWYRRKNKNGSRLKDIATSCRGAGVARNGLKVLIELGFVVQVARGEYKVSNELTV